jgi:hypothetical protein
MQSAENNRAKSKMREFILMSLIYDGDFAPGIFELQSSDHWRKKRMPSWVFSGSTGAALYFPDLGRVGHFSITGSLKLITNAEIDISIQTRRTLTHGVSTRCCEIYFEEAWKHNSDEVAKAALLRSGMVACLGRQSTFQGSHLRLGKWACYSRHLRSPQGPIHPEGLAAWRPKQFDSRRN